MVKHKNTSKPLFATTLVMSENTAIKGVVKQTHLERKALAHIIKHPGCSWREVAARYGWTNRTALVVIRGLLKNKHLAGSVDAMELRSAETGNPT